MGLERADESTGMHASRYMYVYLRSYVPACWLQSFQSTLFLPLSNLRSGILFSGERESVVVRESAVPTLDRAAHHTSALSRKRTPDHRLSLYYM